MINWKAHAKRLRRERDAQAQRIAYLEAEEKKITAALRLDGWRGVTCGPDEAIRSLVKRFKESSAEVARLTAEREALHAALGLGEGDDAEEVAAWLRGQADSLDAAEVARLTAERDGLNESVAAMLERDRWPPCACSYDAPGDVCAVHSPRVAAAEAALAALRERIEALAKEIGTTADDFSRPVEGRHIYAAHAAALRALASVERAK